MSPAVLLKNALGFTLAVGSIPATTAMIWLSLILIVIGALALSVWIFLRAQGVETWQATRSQRWTIAFAISATVLPPVMLADSNYDAPAPPPSRAPALRGIFGRGPGTLAMVSPGGRFPVRCCSPLLNRETAALGTDEPNLQDILLLLPVKASQSVTGLRVEIIGENGLQVSTGSPPQLEPHTYANDAGPVEDDGRHIVNGWIARIPVTMIPAKPWDIGGNRYALNVTATYQVGSDTQPRTFSARGAIEAEVSSAIYEMGAASSVLPLICFGAAFIRWRRTR